MRELLFSASAPLKTLGEVLGPHGWIVVVSFVVSVIATPLVRGLALRWKIVDTPDGVLKPHLRPIAYMGGVAVYAGWVAGMAMLGVYGSRTIGWAWMVGLALAGGVVMLVGLADDCFNIRPVLKLAGQAAAAGVLLAFGIGRDFAQIILKPLGIVGPEWLVLALSISGTVFVVIAACNATNLLDGMDGLCGGVTGIISVMFLILATHLAMYAYNEPHDPVRLIAALAMAGAVCGFLPYNYTPATVFLGDAGSMLLGLFAAGMMIMFAERGIIRWVLGALMIFGLPILDTSLALARRIRLHHPIFGGDRSHLYDQLVDRGFTVKQTVAISYGLSIFYGLVGVGAILVRTRYAVPAYVLVIAATLYLCHRWGFLKPPTEAHPERMARKSNSAT